MANYSLPFFGQHNRGRKTANANTAYTRLIPPMANAYTVLTFLQFTTGATQHIGAIMRPLSFTNVANVAAGAQAVINIVADPGTVNYYGVQPNGTTRRTANNVIAASDYCAYQCTDGTWVIDTVASVATLAITMTGNVPTGGVAAGAPFWFFGIYTDTNPVDAEAQPLFNLYASSTINYGSEGGVAGFLSTYNVNEPLMIWSDNITNASYLERSTAIYLDRGSPWANGLTTPTTPAA